MPTEADRVFRDFDRYTGDGRPNEPANAPLPTGDPRSGIHQPKRFDIRGLMNRVFDAAEDAEEWADVAMSVAGGSTIYATRAALAAAVPVVSYPEGTICYVQGRRYRVDPSGPDGLVAVDMDFRGQIEFHESRMKDGQTVNFAAYGTSTTNGNGTTDWPGNSPTNPDGSAIGSGDYAPPNAWPQRAENILRFMYGHDAIHVWNAGYGGQTIVTGWARENLAAAIIDNPAYGIPDAMFINFCRGDTNQLVYTPEKFREEFELLLSDLEYYGITPVILTPDPTEVNDHRNAAAVLDAIAVQRDLCARHGVRLIDVQKALTDVYSAGGHSGRWFTDQPDSFHGNDRWHRIKGSFVAACMFPNTLWLGDEPVVNVPQGSKYAGTNLSDHNTWRFSNTAVGGSLNVPPDTYVTDQILSSVWVWSLNPRRKVYWHSVDGDGYYHPRPLNNCPTIGNAAFSENTLILASSSAGQVRNATNMRSSEEPCFAGALVPGLSRITFRAPRDNTATVVLLGYFSFRVPAFPLSLTAEIPASGTGRRFIDAYLYNAQPAVASFGNGHRMQMSFEATLPIGSGVFLMRERVFEGATTTAQDVNRRKGLLLFRGDADQVELYLMAFDNANEATAITNLGTATVTWSEGKKFRIRAEVTGAGNQEIRLFDGWANATPIITATNTVGDAPLPFGGWISTFYTNLDHPSRGAGMAAMTVQDIINA